MRHIAKILLLLFAFTSLAPAADTYIPAKVLKWENSTYQAKKNKLGNWVVYTVQSDTATYQLARKKETKPKLQPGEAVQIQVKGNKVNLQDPQGHKTEYQVVGQGQ